MTQYNVTINGSGVSSTPPNEGFIDANNYNYYLNLDGWTGATLALSRANARAGIRWKTVCEQLRISGQSSISNVVATGASVTAQPTSISFSANVADWTSDELLGGLLRGPDAVKRMVARAMIADVTNIVGICDPTLSVGTVAGAIQVVGGVLTPGTNVVPAARALMSWETLLAGKIAPDLASASALITVTAV